MADSPWGGFSQHVRRNCTGGHVLQRQVICFKIVLNEVDALMKMLRARTPTVKYQEHCRITIGINNRGGSD